ncbi:hypothetical protein [Streptomyces sp. NPDC088812]|uniref:hypothetical protein n=1 Tax=Streptomyces sp. NPDC088812 TaxID=3365905 RepID=UPI00381D9CC9
MADRVTGCVLCPVAYVRASARSRLPSAVALGAMALMAPGAPRWQVFLACLASLAALIGTLVEHCPLSPGRRAGLLMMSVLTAAMLPSHGGHGRRADAVVAWFHGGSLAFTEERIPHVRKVAATVSTVVLVFLERPAVMPEIDAAAAAVLADFGAGPEALVDVVSVDLLGAPIRPTRRRPRQRSWPGWSRRRDSGGAGGWWSWTTSPSPRCCPGGGGRRPALPAGRWSPPAGSEQEMVTLGESWGHKAGDDDT